jgi:tRNA/tmRNA/rRNA uracil-C5-methylase (TrmA/RlmC/RlmD family)
MSTAAPPSLVTLQVGDALRLTIDDLAFGGEGVARHHAFVIFVPFVIPGEVVEAEITEVKKQFARARLIQVLEPASNRVVPRCPYFGACGGCQYQHLDYPAQLQVKQRQITELIRRIGGFTNPPVQPTVPCPAPYHYRNRILIRSQWHKPQQRLVLGFLRHDNRLVVDVEECAIADPALNRELRRLRANPPPRGGLKVSLRLPPADWEVPPDSFFQNNFQLLPALIQTVADQLADSGVRHLIDAYCGVGFFGIELAEHVVSFAGIEHDRRAVLAARANAAARHCTNGEIIAGAVEEWLPAVLSRFTASNTAVILDPPRRGCHPSGLECLLAQRPAQILYVSCQPATLARDLNVLCRDQVYRLVNVVPLDMFPQTQHVECVADLRINAAVASQSATGSHEPPLPGS